MRKQSVIIANRHSTSISLEDEFFDELKELARQKDMSINQLVTEIDAVREQENLSSAIRVYILKELKNKFNFMQTKSFSFEELFRQHIFFPIRDFKLLSTTIIKDLFKKNAVRYTLHFCDFRADYSSSSSSRISLSTSSSKSSSVSISSFSLPSNRISCSSCISTFFRRRGVFWPGSFSSLHQ